MTIDRLGRHLLHQSKYQQLQSIGKGDSVLSFFGDGEVSSNNDLIIQNKGFKDFYRNRFYEGTIKHIHFSSPSMTLVINGVRIIRSNAVGIKIKINDIITLKYIPQRVRPKEPYFIEIFLSNDDFT